MLWLLARQNSLERRDAACVERCSCLFPEQCERGFVAPRIAVHPRGDEGVVDVADSQDPSVEPELALAQTTRVAIPVQALMMVMHELLHGRGKAAELTEELDTSLRVPLDGG